MSQAVRLRVACVEDIDLTPILVWMSSHEGQLHHRQRRGWGVSGFPSLRCGLGFGCLGGLGLGRLGGVGFGRPGAVGLCSLGGTSLRRQRTHHDQ